VRASTGLEFPCFSKKIGKRKNKVLKGKTCKETKTPTCLVGGGGRGGQFFASQSFVKTSKQTEFSTRRQNRKKDISDPQN